MGDFSQVQNKNGQDSNAQKGQSFRCDKGARTSKGSQGGLYNWFGWSPNTNRGTLQLTLKGSGTAKIHFGNCWNTGSVNFKKNDVRLADAAPGQTTVKELY